MPRINKIDRTPVLRNYKGLLLRNKVENSTLVKDNGTNLVRNPEINTVSKFALDTIDKFAPLIKKYPKFGAAIISVCEKFINLSEKYIK